MDVKVLKSVSKEAGIITLFAIVASLCVGLFSLKAIFGTFVGAGAWLLIKAMR